MDLRRLLHEIDAGRPVHLWLSSPTAGHSVLGVGYNRGASGTEQWIELYTTWNWGLNEWQWTNETYSGYGFSCFGGLTVDIAGPPLDTLSGYVSLWHTDITDLTVQIGVGNPVAPRGRPPCGTVAWSRMIWTWCSLT